MAKLKSERVNENERACRGVIEAIRPLSANDQERVLWSVLLELQRAKDAQGSALVIRRLDCMEGPAVDLAELAMETTDAETPQQAPETDRVERPLMERPAFDGFLPADDP